MRPLNRRELLALGIIIDSSGSMRDKRAKVAAASLALVKASNPQDEEFILDFNDDAYLDQTLTNDIQKLGAALDRLDSRGRTAMRRIIRTALPGRASAAYFERGRCQEDIPHCRSEKS
jgi:Ca-activated chloride channel homolog